MGIVPAKRLKMIAILNSRFQFFTANQGAMIAASRQTPRVWAAYRLTGDQESTSISIFRTPRKNSFF
jgi:hypothetical protein